MTCHFACTLFSFISYKKKMLTLALLTCYLQKLHCVAISEGEIQGWGLKEQLKVIKVMHQYSHTKGLSGPVCALLQRCRFINEQRTVSRESSFCVCQQRSALRQAIQTKRTPSECQTCRQVSSWSLLGVSGKERETGRSAKSGDSCLVPFSAQSLYAAETACPDGSQSRPWSSLTLKYMWQ